MKLYEPIAAESYLDRTLRPAVLVVEGLRGAVRADARVTDFDRAEWRFGDGLRACADR